MQAAHSLMDPSLQSWSNWSALRFDGVSNHDHTASSEARAITAYNNICGCCGTPTTTRPAPNPQAPAEIAPSYTPCHEPSCQCREASHISPAEVRALESRSPADYLIVQVVGKRGTPQKLIGLMPAVLYGVSGVYMSSSIDGYSWESPRLLFRSHAVGPRIEDHPIGFDWARRTLLSMGPISFADASQKWVAVLAKANTSQLCRIVKMTREYSVCNTGK